MMTSYELGKEILAEISSKINNTAFKEKHTKHKSFTRNRKMCFREFMSFLIHRSTKSYDGKLASLAQALPNNIPKNITKQAISKARQNISYHAFRELFLVSVDHFMKNHSNKKAWKQYQVFAIDGTDLELPSSDKLMDTFGYAKSRFGTRTTKASASALYDVNNDIVLDMVLEPYRTGERAMAKTLIDSFYNKYDMRKSVIVFDRGYPSYEFIQYLNDLSIPFLMRVKTQYKTFISEHLEDVTVIKRYRKRDMELRLVQVQLETGMMEHLITNIKDETITAADFYELYFLRWGVESKYRELKNRFQLEEFSGINPNNIRQDFYINLLLCNLCGLIKKTADEMISLDIKKKELKTTYQANRSVIIERVNNYITEMLLYPKKTAGLMKCILMEAYKKRSQIRTNRKYERNKNVNRRKHSSNNKSCL